MKNGYSIGEAKTQLSKLVRLAEEGEPVVLRRGREPVARIVAFEDEPAPPPRRPGRMRGQIRLAEDFDEWPADVAASLGLDG